MSGPNREELEQAIAAQEALRSVLGDAVVDMTVAALKEKLAALNGPDAEQRKVVTILFADVSGFTAMSEKLDAEEVRDTMNALWAKLDACITSRGGRIDKHIGDAVMALFGVPASQEDDAERAVRAALAMQDALAAFSSELKMRIGLNTGPVLLGSVGTTAEFTAMGDAVNLASRLEHAAPVGGVLISHELYGNVRGIFDVQAQEPLSVKGKKEPVRTYLVRSAKPRSFQLSTRGLDVETAMVGRDAELKRLQDGLQTVEVGKEALLVTVVADAGVGKSRLLYEFMRWLAQRQTTVCCFKGRASPETAARPYGLLRDILSFRFDILDGDGAAAARRKLKEGVLGSLPGDPEAAGKARALGGLVGFEENLQGDPQELRQQALACLTQLFQAAEAAEPVVLLLEDIHWADDASLTAVAELARVCAKRRLFVLSLSRPSIFERRPSWGGDAGIRIDLHPLSTLDSRRLLDDILSSVDAPPEALCELVVSGAEGNPFYVEELVRMLIEEGVIDRSSKPWRVDAGRLAGLKVPPTLVGVLQTRLDGLEPAHRESAQRAAVLGRVFWDAAIGASPAQLEPLLAKEMLIQRRYSSFSGTREYIFKHALLRDVAYESVLKRLRKDYHLKAAEWLVAQSGERAVEFAALIAEHYERASENDKAAEYLEKAAVRAGRAAAYKEADSMLERALKLAPGRFSSMIELAVVRRLDGRYQDAESWYEACRKDPTRNYLPVALSGLAYIARVRGRRDEAARLSLEALSAARGNGDKAAEAEALAELGDSLNALRDHARGRIALEESLALYRELGDRYGEGKVFNDLGVTLFNQGSYQAAFEHYEKSHAAYSSVGAMLDAMLAHANAGQTLIFLGRHEEARRMIAEALEFQKGNGIWSHVAGTVDSLAELSETLGDKAAAEKQYREALAINVSRKMMSSVITNLAGLARLRSDPALAALVLAHPSCNGEGRSRALAVPGAETAKPSATFEQAVARESA